MVGLGGSVIIRHWFALTAHPLTMPVHRPTISMGMSGTCAAEGYESDVCDAKHSMHNVRAKLRSVTAVGRLSRRTGSNEVTGLLGYERARSTARRGRMRDNRDGEARSVRHHCTAPARG